MDDFLVDDVSGFFLAFLVKGKNDGSQGCHAFEKFPGYRAPRAFTSIESGI